METEGTQTEQRELFVRLLESSVLERKDDNQFVPTQMFERVRKQQYNQFQDLSQERRSEVINQYFPELPTSFSEAELETIRDAMAVQEFTSEFTLTESLRVAFAIRRLNDPPRSSGAPDGFTPLRAPEIPLFLQQYSVSIIYIWQDNCSPCDGVSNILTKLVNDGVVDEQVGLGAVSASNQVEFLHNQYEIGFVPTTLFCVGDQVDSRLLGGKRRVIFEKEADIIQDQIENVSC